MKLLEQVGPDMPASFGSHLAMTLEKLFMVVRLRSVGTLRSTSPDK